MNKSNNSQLELFAISTDGLIFKYNRIADCFDLYQNIGERCLSISFIDESKFWFGCEKGLFQYSMITAKASHSTSIDKIFKSFEVGWQGDPLNHFFVELGWCLLVKKENHLGQHQYQEADHIQAE